MLAYYSKEIRVSPSYCDHSGLMSYPAIFSVFMDMAAEHAEDIGLGFDVLAPRHLFWITAKTRIHVNKRPRLMSKITLETWPEVPGRLRCNRDYRIKQDGEVIVTGKTEWAVFDMMNNKVCQSAEVYPGYLEHVEETVLDSGFDRIKDDFQDEHYSEYVIRSTDIDVGGHMNNAAYLKALYSTFSTEDVGCLDYNDIQIIYRNQSFENELLTFFKKTTEDFTDYKICKSDGTVSAVIRMKNCED